MTFLEGKKWRYVILLEVSRSIICTYLTKTRKIRQSTGRNGGERDYGVTELIKTLNITRNYKPPNSESRNKRRSSNWTEKNLET